MQLALLLIDCQNDFIDNPERQGSLAVPGSYSDMHNIAMFLHNNGSYFKHIVASLDNHSAYHISHTNFWLEDKGNEVKPFTLINLNSFKSALYRPRLEQDRDKALYYLTQLEKVGRATLCLWPLHCLSASYGAALYPILQQQLSDWEIEHGVNVHYVSKGNYPYSEHYSLLRAEVPVKNEVKTHINTHLINSLMQYDEIVVAGEALSHCVRFSLEDLLANSPNKMASKITLLTNCSSPVAGFEEDANKFITYLKKQGVRCMNSSDWLAKK
jgi:nicotinamidase-related amidase